MNLKINPLLLSTQNQLRMPFVQAVSKPLNIKPAANQNSALRSSPTVAELMPSWKTVAAVIGGVVLAGIALKYTFRKTATMLASNAAFEEKALGYFSQKLRNVKQWISDPLSLSDKNITSRFAREMKILEDTAAEMKPEVKDFLPETKAELAHVLTRRTPEELIRTTTEIESSGAALMSDVIDHPTAKNMKITKNFLKLNEEDKDFFVNFPHDSFYTQYRIRTRELNRFKTDLAAKKLLNHEVKTDINTLRYLYKSRYNMRAIALNRQAAAFKSFGLKRNYLDIRKNFHALEDNFSDLTNEMRASLEKYGCVSGKVHFRDIIDDSRNLFPLHARWESLRSRLMGEDFSYFDTL